MDLKHIGHGTSLSIGLEAPPQNLKKEYKAKFYDMSGEQSFVAESKELYNDFKDFDNDTVLIVSFFQSDTLYTFRGVAKSTATEFSARLTRIEQISEIEVSVRRTHPRHEISVPVYVFSDVPGKAEEALFSGYASDISLGGISILSNKEYNIPADQVVKLSFTLGGYFNFLLDAQFVRAGESPRFSQYKYSCSLRFLFNEENDEAEAAKQRGNLSAALLSHKLGNR